MAVAVNQPHLLIVEGKEEVVFFEALIRHLGLQAIQIVDMEGKTRLKDRLSALTAAAQFANVVSLGVVRDANSDPVAAFQSVRDALRSAKLPVPEHPLLAAGQSPRVTVMIVPEAGAPGMLKDLCLRAVQADPAMPCVERYFECLQEQGLPWPRNRSKARVQTFLASRSEPGKRLGEAAQAGYWPWEDSAFEQVKGFLRQLVVS